MASPNTIAIMNAKIALRSKTIRNVITMGHGPNRAARRKAQFSDRRPSRPLKPMSNQKILPWWLYLPKPKTD